jgi:hypothetical protein
MVRPERASIALTHAVRQYAQGIGMMTTGMRENSISEKVSLVKRGYRRILSTLDDDGEDGKKCNEKDPFREETEKDPPISKNCNQFSENTCAASALLIAFFEIMDTCVSPSPPLIMRSDFKVKEFYIAPNGNLDIYDVNNFASWHRDKQNAYKSAFARFQAYYETMGFKVIGKSAVTGENKLNFDDWGVRDHDCVPNPARVREETYLFRFLGKWRPERNRLQIDRDTYNIWMNHEIQPGYDLDFAKKYQASPGRSIKRPIIPLHDVGELYQASTPNVVEEQTRIHIALNKLSTRDYIAFCKDEDNEIKVEKDNFKELPTTALACKDLHDHWQLTSMVGNLSYGLLDKNEDSKEWMFIHSDINGYGIEVDKDIPTIWEDNKANLSLADKSILNDLLTERPPACFHPPPLFNRLVHPLNGERVPIEYFQNLIPSADVKRLLRTPRSLVDANIPNLPVWFNKDPGNQQDITFPYPLLTLSGTLDVTYHLLPSNPDISIVYPTIDEKGYGWDIRHSLTCLLGIRGQEKLTNLIDIMGNGNMAIRTRDAVINAPDNDDGNIGNPEYNLQQEANPEENSTTEAKSDSTETEAESDADSETEPVAERLRSKDYTKKLRSANKVKPVKPVKRLKKKT